MELSTSDDLHLSGSSSSAFDYSPSCSTSSDFLSQLQGNGQHRSTLQSGTDGLSERTFFTDEDGDDRVQVVIVGGDIGALSAALALSSVENVKVILVNVGLGLETSASLGANFEKRGLQLSTRAVSLLEGLGFSTNLRSEGIERINDIHTSGPQSVCPGAVIKGFCLRRYEDGAILTRQSYKALPPTRAGSDEIPCLTIDSEDLRQSLLALCLGTPNIDLRPRCVVADILRQECVATAARTDEKDILRMMSLSDNQDDTMVDLDSDTFGVEEDAFGDIGSFSASKTVFATEDTYRHRSPGTDKLWDGGRRESRHGRRESFIQFDDDEIDFMSGRTLSPPDWRPVLLQPDTLEEPTDLDPFASEENSSRHDSKDGSLLIPFSMPLHQVASAGRDDTQKALQFDSCPVVDLTSGERIFADVVLGSMAPRSEVLRMITDSITKGDVSNEQKVKSNLEVVREDRVYRAFVATDKLRREPELKEILSEEIVSWLGPERHVTCFPINGGDTYYISVACAHPQDMIGDDPSAIIQQLKREVTTWCPQVVKLASLVEFATVSAVNDYAAPETWISSCGKIALIGNAAHPLLPFAPEELTLILEDAVTLRSLFSRLQSVQGWQSRRRGTSIQYLLKAFVELRRPRCIRAQLLLRAGRDLFWLPDGESQRRRDFSLKEGGLLDEDEEELEHRFDPTEAVQSWWQGQVERQRLSETVSQTILSASKS